MEAEAKAALSYAISPSELREAISKYEESSEEGPEMENAKRRLHRLDAGKTIEVGCDVFDMGQQSPSPAGVWAIGDVVEVEGRRGVVTLDLRSGHDFGKVRWEDTQEESGVLRAATITRIRQEASSQSQLSVSLNQRQLVSEAKSLILAQSNCPGGRRVPVKDVELKLGGEVLRDDQTLEACGVETQATLRIIVNQTHPQTLEIEV